MAVRRRHRSKFAIEEKAQEKLYSSSINGVVAKEPMGSDCVGARTQTFQNKRGPICDHQQSGLCEFSFEALR